MSIDYDQMTLSDLVGYARGLRLEAEAYGGNHAGLDGVVSLGRMELLTRDTCGDGGRTLQPTLPQAVTPFWQSLASDRDEKIAQEAGPNPGEGYVLRADGNGRYSWEDAHAAHKRLPVAKRIRECRPCGEAAIRRMASLSELDHRGRNGRRLAEIFGVRL